MLRDLCRVVENDDGFVGLRFAGGRPEVVFPRGFRLAEDDKDVRQDIIRLFGAIRRFGDHREGDRTAAPESETELSFPIQSYQYVIYDFLRNGYYAEREVRYVESPRGKINWKRTIQMEQPRLDGDNVVYLNFIVKTNRISSGNLLTRIHEYCVYESFQKMGWLYVSGDALPMKPRIPFNRTLFLSALTKELGQTFNDGKRKLFQCMINIINEVAEEANDDSEAAFGVRRFEYVWEAMIDYVFGESNRERFYPRAHWIIVDRNGRKRESSELRPDTIMKLDGRIYILDAKYYKFGITGRPEHLPGSDSIQKQITYGDYVAERCFAPRNSIYNAFLMPYCAPADNGAPFKFASVGMADWRTYGRETENYNYILGILVDAKYLVTTYARHNSTEIERLGALIEESLGRYRQAVS